MKDRSFRRQRPLPVLAAGYALGVFIGTQWKDPSPLLPIAGMIAALAALLLLRGQGVMGFVSIGFAFLFLGILLSGVAAHPSLPGEGVYQVTARVSGESEQRETDGRVTALLKDVALTGEDGVRHQIGSAHWTYYPSKGSTMPMDGQEASFTGSLYHPQGQVNPYGFDFRMFLLQRSVAAGISGARDLCFAPTESSVPQSLWLRMRQGIAARLDSLFQDGSGLAKALLLGVREGLSEKTVADFRDAGIAHVLAVSGLHVSLLTAMVFLVLRLFRLPPAAVFGLIAALLVFYCRLLDFAPSVVRASVLTLLLLLGRVLRRRADPLTGLSFAFLLILLFRPLDLFNAGFQLSFLAVLGIITLGDRLNFQAGRSQRFERLPRPVKGIIQSCFVTISASAMTALPLLNTFHRLSPIGLIISPPAVSLIGLMMAGYIFPLFVSLVSMPAAQLLSWPALMLSRAYEAGIGFAAGLPGAVLTLPSLTIFPAMMLFALMLLLTRYVRLKRATRTLGIIGAAMVLSLSFLPKKPDAVFYLQLSAGDADSAVIFDGPATWAIDTGGHGGDLAGLLLSQGRTLDKLFLTHLHEDHTGGLRQLLDNRVVIREILLPYGAETAELTDGSLLLLREAQAAGIPVTTLAAGDVLSSGRVSAEVFWPVRGALYPGLEPNKGSLVMRLDLDGISLLSSGDVSSDYAKYAVRPAQVLKAPHHGSKADNEIGTLGMVSPQLGLISAAGGQPDRYKAALERLAGIGADTLVTGERGAVTLRVPDGPLEVTTFLKGEE